MSDAQGNIDWSKTTFDGSRREQVCRWLKRSVRERLEALNDLKRSVFRESIRDDE